MAVAIAHEDYIEKFDIQSDDFSPVRSAASSSATSNALTSGASAAGVATSPPGSPARRHTPPRTPGSRTTGSRSTGSRPSRGRTTQRRNPSHTETHFEDDEDETVVARRRTRRAHRHRTLSLPVIGVGLFLLLQLTAVLYVQALGLSAVHRADKLDTRIAQLHDEIKQKQRAISVRTSTAQLEQWAQQLGLRRVQQSDIDRVNEAARPRERSLTEESSPRSAGGEGP